MTTDPFRPVDAPWQPVAPALVRLKRLTVTAPLMGSALVLTGVCALLFSLDVPTWISALFAFFALIALGGTAWSWRWARRHRDAWGYAELDDDFLVTSGVLFKRLVTIPYGRMQYVDVTAGPVERWMGMATVTLNTASRETAAHVPGLPPGEARRLRERLLELGDVHGAGV